MAASSSLIEVFFSQVLPFSTGAIALTGSITNSISLSYFIRKGERTLTNRNFMFLNVSDLLVSVVIIAVVTFYHCEGSMCGRSSPYYRVAIGIFDVFLNGTAFATCLLSVTRTVSLCFPFYQISKKAVGVAAMIFVLEEIVKLLLGFYFYYTSKSGFPMFNNFENGLMITSLATLSAINLISSVISAWKLLKIQKQLGVAQCKDQAPRPNTNRKATVTILLVAVIASFFNINSAVFFYDFHFGGFSLTNKNMANMMIGNFALWIATPLNSSINPIIYFTRKKDMRKYIKSLFYKSQ